MKLPKLREHFNIKNLSFFLVALFLFWIKTYIAYRIEFNLGIQNLYQHFLLFINPISSGAIFLALSLFLKGRAQHIVMTIIAFILTLVLYANIVFYRFFNDFITLPVLFQTKNFGDVSGSAEALMKPYDFLYFLDILILIALIVFKVMKPAVKLPKKSVVYVLGAGVLAFFINLGLAEIDRPQLLSRTFDRNYLVKYLGAYNYTLYDAVQNIHSSAQRAMADSGDVNDVLNYTKAHDAKPNDKYFGKGKGMNVIYVSLESFQSFLIDRKVNGQEVTPFLNALTHDKNTFYFDHFYHQTGQGKTSDAEFLMENSLFPLPQGSVFYLKSQNTYQATPAILKSKGYTSAVFHGNYKSFWNRDVMYQSLGIDKFFDARYYDMQPDHVLNYGMEDKPYFKESMPLLENLKQPFYSRFISLSNHFDFELDDEDVTFPPGDYGDSVVNRYFQTAHYTDEAIAQFFNDLKTSGLYDNSIIILYGDHYGISENHNRALSKVLGKEITPYENTKLQRVPLFIHVPNVKSPGKPLHTYGGEIDVRPTLLHLLGIDTKNYIQFGSDLLSKEHSNIVPFRNGDFVTPDYTYTKGVCYSNKSEEKVSEKKCEPYDKVTKEKLSLSDKVVYEDLLRFYTPKDFTPFDKNKIDYRREVQDADLPKSVLPHYDNHDSESSTSNH
ncbi:lipoteichoic acid synthase [Pullulanibacillus pueri]|uniref:Lipoteichoic acid synthase 2 n=1 Tax=Pullulanibacillus pueri TaxID=1437324 RepID=A0A8J2ZSR7_9BACL|nr:LTA synthase family protein [Pullulanibacillus pueri]MBM7680356.1 lipoteichoic acid synthase [Pullulanibacillus pueri]GGH75479.1 lipoteichoic acid synthase 2 [Pullulanibacillus pueri]